MNGPENASESDSTGTEIHSRRIFLEKLSKIINHLHNIREFVIMQGLKIDPIDVQFSKI